MRVVHDVNNAATGRGRCKKGTYILIAIRTIRQTNGGARHEANTKDSISESEQNPVDTLYKAPSSALVLTVLKHVEFTVDHRESYVCKPQTKHQNARRKHNGSRQCHP